GAADGGQHELVSPLTRICPRESKVNPCIEAKLTRAMVPAEINRLMTTFFQSGRAPGPGPPPSARPPSTPASSRPSKPPKKILGSFLLFRGTRDAGRPLPQERMVGL